MTVGMVIGLAVVTLLALMFLRIPVGLALTISGLLGIFLVRGTDIMWSTAASTPFTSTGQYALIVVPMFILMGAVANQSGLAAQIFTLASRVVGKMPGGLGVAAVLTCGVFAAISGSSIATVASIGPVAVAELTKRDYSPGFAAGIIAGAGTLGVLIPPSVVLVLYAIITGEKVSDMLLAGIIPGILSIVIYSSLVIARHYFAKQDTATTTDADAADMVPRPADAGALVSAGDVTSRSSIGDSLPTAPTSSPVVDTGSSRAGISALIRIGIVFVVVIGGIYTGIFTATEASALGAVIVVALSMLDIRTAGFRGWIGRLRDSIAEAAQLTGATFFVVVGAAVFSFFLVTARAPTRLSEWIADLNVPPALVIVAFLLLMIPLGMFLDAISCLLIVAPLAYPIVDELGFSGIWFGVLLVKMVELGMITPPVGLNVFVISAAVPNVTVLQAFRGVTLFAIGDVFIVAILFAAPVLVTVLPSLAST